MKSKKRSLLIYLMTGVFLALLCTAVCAAAIAVPLDKMKSYLNILFMDQMNASSASGTNGLVIVENENIPTEAPTETLSEEGEVVRPSFGEQYAVLKCEAISLSVPVYWGSSPELLERGACQSSSSKVLGETGNVVIDAHVNTFFADLNKIKPGDEIRLYTEYGIFTYKATEQVSFVNTDKTYILPTEEDRLTLYTCEAQVLGVSAMRIGVLGDLVSKQFYAGEGTHED